MLFNVKMSSKDGYLSANANMSGKFSVEKVYPVICVLPEGGAGLQFLIPDDTGLIQKVLYSNVVYVQEKPKEVQEEIIKEVIREVPIKTPGPAERDITEVPVGVPIFDTEA